MVIKITDQICPLTLPVAKSLPTVRTFRLVNTLLFFKVFRFCRTEIKYVTTGTFDQPVRMRGLHGYS